MLAGGGTAGHTSPLIATAEAIRNQAPAVEITCIGTAKGLETRVIPAAGLELQLIEPVPLPRTVGVDLLKLPVKLARSTGQARRILKRSKAEVLVGFGGYVSIPAYLAAASLRIPVVVHEANKLPGVANKVGARLARFVATTFSETKLRGGKRLGMPIARQVTNPTLTDTEARSSFGLAEHQPTLLVSGGSQGAVKLNEAVLAAVPELLDRGFQVLHILGQNNFNSESVPIDSPTGGRYRPVPFVENMATAYAAADLMLARAGAATVMETAVSGLPVIFVPLPWGNGEQEKNAADLIRADAGVLLPEAELSRESILAIAGDLLTDSQRLTRMSQAAANLYPRDAADQLASAVLASRKADGKKAS